MKFSSLAIFLGLFLFFAIGPSTTNAATIGVPTDFMSINKGLVAWWTLDGKDTISNISDRSGNGMTGYMQDDNDIISTSSQQVAGKIGQAFSFNGTSNFVVVPSGTALAVPFTISFWFYPRAINVNQGLFCLALNEYCILLHSNNRINPDFSGVVDTVRAFSNKVFGSADLNKWWHLAIVVDNANDASSWKIYINGVDNGLDSSSAGVGRVPSAQTWQFGAFYNNSWWFNGEMDDIRVYNRSLSAAEVRQLYNFGVVQQSSSPSAASNTGLIGRYTLDGKDTDWNTRKTIDVAGGNTGTLIGLSTTTSPVLGKVGQALNFNGTSDYIDTANFADNLSNFTVSAWFKAPSTAVQPICGGQIVSKLGSGGASSGNGWTLALGGGSCSIGSNQIYGMIQSNGGGNWMTKYSTATYNDNKWHNATMVVTGGTTITLYVDNVVATNVTNSGVIGSITNSSNVRIGNDYDGEYFKGSIDDVRIYNRALSANEVLQIYNAGTNNSGITPVNPIKSSLLGWWTFDGKDTNWNTNKVSDLSGNSRTGSIVGISTTTGPALGKLGQALNFNGSTSFINTANFADNLSNFTVSTWFRTSTSQAGVGGVIVGKLATPGLVDGTGWAITLVGPGASPIPLCAVNYNIQDGGAGAWVGKDTTGTYCDGKWHHAVMVVTGGNTMVAYLDGSSSGTVDDSGGPAITTFSNSSNVKIGTDDSSESFNGAIDDTRIYNRALTANEVLRLYNMGK